MVIKDTVKHRTSTCLNLHVISGGAMDSKSTSGLEDEEYSSQNRIFQSVGLVSTVSCMRAFIFSQSVVLPSVRRSFAVIFIWSGFYLAGVLPARQEPW